MKFGNGLLEIKEKSKYDLGYFMCMVGEVISSYMPHMSTKYLEVPGHTMCAKSF